MQPVLNVDDIKRVEVALTRVGVSVSELMHRAGYAAAAEMLELGGIDNVVVLTGMGNNGGDGWVAAEALLRKHINVKVVTPIDPDQLSGDLARQVAQSAVRAGVPTLVGPSRDELEGLFSTADAVLDCMLGTGFHGEPRAPFDIWIECLNASGARVVSVDVPSGLSAQSGHAPGAAVVADMTVTMLALKPGLLADDGRDLCGPIVVAPLAEQTERLVNDADPVAWRTDLSDYLEVMLPPVASVDKFSRGSVLVVGWVVALPLGLPSWRRRRRLAAGAGYCHLGGSRDDRLMRYRLHLLEIPVIGLPCRCRLASVSSEARAEVVRLARGKLHHARRDLACASPTGAVSDRLGASQCRHAARGGRRWSSTASLASRPVRCPSFPSC